MLSLAYYDDGDTKQAEKYLNVLFKKRAEKESFYRFCPFDELVRIYKQEKKIRQVGKKFVKSGLAQPEDVGLLTELGVPVSNQGRLKKLVIFTRGLFSMESDNPVFYCLWGESLVCCRIDWRKRKSFYKGRRNWFRDRPTVITLKLPFYSRRPKL